MDIGSVSEVLRECINNPVTLANAVDYLKEYIQTPGFVLGLSMIISQSSQDNTLKKICFKL